LNTIDIFGTGRCRFASNFPVDRLWSSYDVLFDAFSEITDGFSEDERTAMFSCNAARIYRV